MENISVSGMTLIDESGRERIFNGVNLVYKGGDGRVPTDWTEDMFRRLSELGINLVRLGLIWSAIEPLPGVYNEEYLDKMGNFIDLCDKYGIYVYLDMHQDVWCAVNGYEDGAPPWATLTDGYHFKKPKVIWAEGYYFGKATHRAFDHFWNNDEVNGKGLQDYFADMWKHVILHYRDKGNILGYDVFNEPFPGTDGGKAFQKIIGSAVKTVLSKKVKKGQALKNMVKGDFVTEALAVLDDPAVLRSGTSGADALIRKFDTEKYYPFMKKMAAAIRSVTDKGIIFMEACYYSNISIPSSTPRIRYDDGKLEENLVFSPHGYDLTVDSYLTNTASFARVETIFNEHKRTQKRLQVPVIVGEWGGMVPGCEEYPHLESLLAYFDENHWSHTYWAFWPWFAEEKIMKIIARPYPVAVPGRIESYRFDRKTNTFTLKFSAPKETESKIEIYSPSVPVEILSEKEAGMKKIGNSEAVLLSISPIQGENLITVKL